MATQQHNAGSHRDNSTLYRITPNGKAVAAWEQHDSRTRHLTDLLHLLQSCAHGMAEAQMRQFMPAESLMRAIASLVALGLIEPHEAQQARQAQAGWGTEKVIAPGAGMVMRNGVRRL
ncbi:hypothetical protein [Ramlibacter sp. PS4R-6]|uniref:hypothetical protein n=1 Tax=Ramlibacter sp. PS4R-6 TaxID=3133438 RepID=UPI00309E52FD